MTDLREDDLPSSPAAWRAVFGVAWRASPAGALVTGLGWFVATIVAGPLLALAVQNAVGGRGLGDPVWVIALIVGVILPEPLLSLVDHVRDIVRRRGEQRISEEIIRSALRPNGIEHLENPRFADRVTFLRGQAQAVAQVFGNVAGQTGLIVGFLCSVALLASVSWWLLLPVLGATALGTAQVRAARTALSVREGTLPAQRMADLLVNMSTTASAAGDVRMLGIGDWMTARFDAAVKEVGHTMLRSERRHVVVAGASGALQALMLVSGLGLLLWLAGRHEVSSGGVLLGVFLLQTTLESARGLALQGSFVLQTSFAARRYLWLLRYPETVPSAADPVPVPDRLDEGIRLEGVSFRYPFTSRDVLHDVTLDLPPGATVALVGENGSGKSTLIKLLCRYYDPTDGRITVDGTDLRDLDPDGWREALTAGFQDFVRLEFPAAESIGASRPDLLDGHHPEVDELIVQAAVDGRADEFIAGLPDGYRSQLGRQFGGAQLSEGQWQRVAMSRTFVRRRPLLMLLDEPTAALDPRAEHQLFQRLTEQAGQARGAGSVTLVVSHRFSTVAMADLIVVLEDGRVAEVGDHGTLSAADGLYRRLFDAQAQRYLDDTDATDVTDDGQGAR